MVTFDIWVFPAVFGITFILAHEILKRAERFKRPFYLKRRDERGCVGSGAFLFLPPGIGPDERPNGRPPVHLSVRTPRLGLADRGINEKVATDTWQEIVDHLISGIKEKRQGMAICEALRGALES